MSCSVRGWWRCALALAAAVVLPGLAGAQETEPNDTFAEAQVVPGDIGGATLISGELMFLPYDVVEFATLEEGAVDYYDITGLAPGSLYGAFIDNLVGVGAPDTMMRSMDEFGVEVAFNDDDSPFGDGFASGFISTVNADGSLHLEVTGYPDEFFEGLHEESGEYALVLKYSPLGDVDYFHITGLVPGTAWTAETLAAPGEDPIDTVLTEYDELGALVAQNDDIDFDNGIYLSELSGIVPASGELFLAATAWPDFDSVGDHITVGQYGLQLTYTAVPEPGTLAIAAIAGLSACFVARRRKA